MQQVSLALSELNIIFVSQQEDEASLIKLRVASETF